MKFALTFLLVFCSYPAFSLNRKEQAVFLEKGSNVEPISDIKQWTDPEDTLILKEIPGMSDLGIFEIDSPTVLQGGSIYIQESPSPQEDFIPFKGKPEKFLVIIETGDLKKPDGEQGDNAQRPDIVLASVAQNEPTAQATTEGTEATATEAITTETAGTEATTAQDSPIPFQPESVPLDKIVGEPTAQTNATTSQQNNGAIKCKGNGDDYVKAVCLLCQADEAYALTKDNWFLVGLAHNYKIEFSKFYSYAQKIFPDTNWLASFGGENICLVSKTNMPNIDLEHTINYVTHGHLSDYTKYNLVPINQNVTVDLSGIRYVPLGQESYIDQFVLRYKINFSVPIITPSSLSFTTAWIHTAEKTITYSGTTNLQGTAPIPLLFGITQEKTFYYVNTTIPTDLSLSVTDILNGVHVSDIEKSGIFDQITIKNGLINLGSFRVSSLDFKILSTSKKVDQFVIGLSAIPDFSLTPEFVATNMHASLIMELAGTKCLPTLVIEGRVTDHAKNLLDLHLLKSKQEENIILRQNEKSNQFKIVDIENLFRIHDPFYRGLFPNYTNFEAIREHYIPRAEIHVKRDPVSRYLIKTNIIENEEIIGDFEAIIIFLGENAVSKTKVSLPKKSVLLLLPQGSTLFVEQYMDTEGLDLLYYSNDLDASHKGPAFDDLKLSEQQWVKGITVTYKFKLRNCSDTAFCQVVTSMENCQANTITLTGNIDANNTLKLASDVLPGQINLSAIDFTNIRLNIDIPLNSNSGAIIYLASQNSLKVETDKVLNLDGTLTFDETHAKLLSKTDDTWDHALGLDFVQISGIEVTGVVNPGSCYITDVAAKGIMLWGKGCLLFSQEEARNGTFLKERCFYGLGDVMLNLNDAKKSYLSGIYTGLSPFIILASILEYDDPFVFQKVSKQFLEFKFLDYVEIMYVPKKGEAKQDANQTALIEIEEENNGYPAGLAIKGNSELMGLQGIAKLNIDVDTKEIYQLFHFETSEIAHSNIVLTEDSLEASNNIQFKISDRPNDDNNGKAQMQTRISLMGMAGLATFTFSNQNTSFKAIVHSDYLKNIEVSGLTYDVKNFLTANFSVQGKVWDDLSKISNPVRDLLKDWYDKISNNLNQADETMEKIETFLKDKAEKQCNPNSCPKRLGCGDEMVYECTKYKKKQICKRKGDYCLDSGMGCQRFMTFCTHEVETCITDNALADGECLEKRSGCKSHLTVCEEWAYVCGGEKLNTCDEYEIVDDLSGCLEYAWRCNEVEIQDPQCKSECDFKRKQQAELAAAYNRLKTRYDDLPNNIQGLKNFISLLEKSDCNLKMVSFEFEVEFDRPLNVLDIPWILEYSLFDQKRVLEFRDFMGLDERKLTEKIYSAIKDQLSKEFSFTWMSPEELQGFIEGKLDFQSMPKSFFLEMSKLEYKISDKNLGTVVAQLV